MSLLCVKILLQGDVTGRASCTSNRVIQFHALSVFLLKQWLFVLFFLVYSGSNAKMYSDFNTDFC